MNTQFKSYSSHKSAVKGAVRAGFSKDDVYENEEGKFGFDIEVEQEAPTAALVPVAPAPAQEAPKATKTESKTGRKIEKDRPMQNGVKMPSAGTKCREVWDFCASVKNIDAKAVKAAAEARGWNPNNASIEYYNWRKFMGIHGRAKKQAAA